MRAATTNILFAEMVKSIQRLEPSVVHQCPYNDIIIKNKILDATAFPIFSAGTYKLWTNATTKKDENLFSVMYIIEWLSSERNSFG